MIQKIFNEVNLGHDSRLQLIREFITDVATEDLKMVLDGDLLARVLEGAEERVVHKLVVQMLFQRLTCRNMEALSTCMVEAFTKIEAAGGDLELSYDDAILKIEMNDSVDLFEEKKEGDDIKTETYLRLSQTSKEEVLEKYSDKDDTEEDGKIENTPEIVVIPETQCGHDSEEAPETIAIMGTQYEKDALLAQDGANKFGIMSCDGVFPGIRKRGLTPKKNREIGKDPEDTEDPEDTGDGKVSDVVAKDSEAEGAKRIEEKREEAVKKKRRSEDNKAAARLLFEDEMMKAKEKRVKEEEMKRIKKEKKYPRNGYSVKKGVFTYISLGKLFNHNNAVKIKTKRDFISVEGERKAHETVEVVKVKVGDVMKVKHHPRNCFFKSEGCEIIMEWDEDKGGKIQLLECEGSVSFPDEGTACQTCWEASHYAVPEEM